MIKFELLILALLLPFSGHAFEVMECQGVALNWDENLQPMRGSARSFPTGTDWRTAVETGVSRWNQNPSNFRFQITFENDVGRDNRENEIWFTDDQDVLDGAPALAAVSSECVDTWVFGIHAKLIEADIIADNQWNFTPLSDDKSALEAYKGTKRPFTNTMIHELGHALGLHHADDVYNIMGQSFTHLHANGGRARSYAGEDASSGAVLLYGERSGRLEDVSVTHWKFDQPGDDGYSDHVRTGIYSTSDAAHGNVGGLGEPKYLVVRGTDVKMEMTYENSGKSRHQSLKVGFYLSSNSRITTLDRRIGGATLDLGRNVPVTKRHKISIPSDIAAGNWFVGAIVDEDDEIEEVTERNNATYVALRVNDP